MSHMSNDTNTNDPQDIEVCDICGEPVDNGELGPIAGVIPDNICWACDGATDEDAHTCGRIGNVMTERPAYVDDTLAGCDRIDDDPFFDRFPSVRRHTQIVRQYLDECDNEGEWPADVDLFVDDVQTYVACGGADNLTR